MITKTKKKAKEAKDVDLDNIIKSIQKGKGGQVDRGSDFGRKLLEKLSGMGYIRYTTYSECSKASFEAHVSNGKQTVDIVSSYFMGCFTEVSVGKV